MRIYADFADDVLRTLVKIGGNTRVADVAHEMEEQQEKVMGYIEYLSTLPYDLFDLEFNTFRYNIFIKPRQVANIKTLLDAGGCKAVQLREWKASQKSAVVKPKQSYRISEYGLAFWALMSGVFVIVATVAYWAGSTYGVPERLQDLRSEKRVLTNEISVLRVKLGACSANLKAAQSAKEQAAKNQHNELDNAGR